MLGIIPGTTIQITFDDWLYLVALLCGALLVIRIIRHVGLIAGIVRRVRERKLTARLA